MTASIDRFPALEAIPGLVHGFTKRVPALDVQVEREAALGRLEEAHTKARAQLGLAGRAFVTARQVHGAEVARVSAADAGRPPEADGLITDDPRVCLGIYVADCGSLYLVDPERRALGLVHSGRKGSDLGIAGVAVRRMAEEFGSQPADLIAQLGPCIRPPHYEVDFAAQIVASCRQAGLTRVYDCGLCTAAHPAEYYSYRRELGRTGRMLALLAWADPGGEPT